jgi:hypothetical protein
MENSMIYTKVRKSCNHHIAVLMNKTRLGLWLDKEMVSLIDLQVSQTVSNLDRLHFDFRELLATLHWF